MWDRTKWNQFVQDHTDPLPTDASSIRAISEANKLATKHQEDIDLDALGVQRVKEYLEDIATGVPGSQGPIGLPGIPGDNSLILLASAKISFPAGTAGIFRVLRHIFAPNELDGTKDLIRVSVFLYNSASWTRWNGANIDTLGATNGYVESWIAQSTDNVAARNAAIIGVGARTYVRTSVIAADWMAAGGRLDVVVTQSNAALPNAIYAAVYKFVFPQVTVE